MTASRTGAREPDWNLIRRRLADAERALAAPFDLSSERARAIIDKRTRALARTALAHQAATDPVDLVVFAVGGGRYGIETRHVRETVAITQITPVPGAGDGLLGVTYLRGDILPVADPRALLPMASRGLMDFSFVVVLGRERAEYGLAVQAIHEVEAIDRADLRDIADPSARKNGQIWRMTPAGTLLLDGAALLGAAFSPAGG